jgi:hypothetical protein
MSLVVNLIVRATHRYAVPMFIRTVRRFPPAFACVVAVGQAIGAWLVCECGPAGDWPMAGLGVLMLGFYTGLLGLVTVKWWDRSWGEFCDYVLSQVE